MPVFFARQRRPLLFLFILVLASLQQTGESRQALAGSFSWRALNLAEPLTIEEERSPAAQDIARRFNPAMAFPSRDIWPTDVSYSWHDGSPLMGRIVAGTGRVLREFVARAHSTLQDTSWADLPRTDASGNRIEYYVDGPGDDREEAGLMRWVQRWREITGTAPESGPEAVTQTAYPPTQYAHLYWVDRSRGLLGVQYWFYYPFDQWINNHEGDWEHINVILQGPDRLADASAFTPVGYQYYFHETMYEPPRVVRVGGRRPDGDHVMVFAGGRGDFLFRNGIFSGGSYPLPANYPGAGGIFGMLRGPDDDTREPVRYIHADEFRVVLLPEPERLDAGERPELSWLRLPFFAGQPRVYHNLFVLDWLKRNSAPPQPGERPDWNGGTPQAIWTAADEIRVAPLRLPEGWRTLEPRLFRPPVVAASRRYLRAASR